MSSLTSPADANAIEECVDQLDEMMATLERYPETVLAVSLRLHLGALLRALVDAQLCNRGEVRQFVLELEQEALGVGE